MTLPSLRSSCARGHHDNLRRYERCAVWQAARGSQSLTGLDGVFNELVGDAFALLDKARGGADSLTGGSGAPANNHLYGDALTAISDAARAATTV